MVICVWLLSAAWSAQTPLGEDFILGPNGVDPLHLLDLPDLDVHLNVRSGQGRFVGPGGELRDGEIEPGSVTTWTLGTGRIYLKADKKGQISRITWSSGRIVRVERDESDRIVGLFGPASRQIRVDWSRGLELVDTVGSRLSVQTDELGWTIVRDGVGRQVRSRAEVSAAGEASLSWEDPRGMTSVVRSRGDIVEVVGPNASVWRTSHIDGAGWLETPDAMRWTWVEDENGHLLAVRDPTGSLARWEYDALGNVVLAEVDGRQTRASRDADGRLLAWTDAQGANYRLTRLDGLVSEVVDPSGAKVVLERDATGRVVGLFSRAGGRWELAYGLDGELSRVRDPVGRELVIDRNGDGRVIATQFDGAITRYRRRADTRISQVIAADGSITDFVRDSAGRVREVRGPGRVVTVERDAAGDVVGVLSDGLEVRVSRDVAGRVVRAGPIEWVRDLLGGVIRLTAPGVELVFKRDVLGRLRRVESGSLASEVVRDAHGWPVSWSGAGETVRVVRDAMGRVLAETLGDQTHRIVRGVRGTMDRVETARGIWRWSRGADGGVLRNEGPDGVGVGTDFDDAGRQVLVRMPGGGLLRRTFEDGLVVEVLNDKGGEPVVRSAWQPGAGGAPAWSQVDDAPRLAWTWDGNGNLDAVESPDGDGERWLFDREVEVGPGGWMRARDYFGRTTELTAGEFWPAWGELGGAWAYERDEVGRLARVTGSTGAYSVEHDPFGRLVAVRGPQASWLVDWDARGRPLAIHRPGGTVDVWWLPGADGGTPLATGPSGQTAWMDAGLGARAWSRLTPEVGPTGAGVVRLPGFAGEFIEDPLGVLRVRLSPAGVADSAAPDPVGARGGLSLFTGGPELFTGVALDSASFERTDGTLDWPWMRRDHRARVNRMIWDPSVWRPEVPWGEPLAIARSLQWIHIPDGATRPRAQVAWSWLPPSLDMPNIAVGPAGATIRVADELEPLVGRIVDHVAENRGGITWDVVVGALMDADEVGWLPPGLAVPGIENAGMDGHHAAWANFDATFEQKVLAEWSGPL